MLVKHLRQITIYFLIFLALTLLISLVYYRTINLLTFINTSFAISSVMIFVSLFIFITQKGFFDGITYGFRRIFATKQALKEMEDDVRNMRPPSELAAPIRLSSLFSGACILFLCMMISLYFFYNF